MSRENGKSANVLEIPATLPLLVLEDAVVFPGPVAALSMEGDALAKAEAVLREGTPLVALGYEQAETSAEGESNGSEEEGALPRLRPVGTVARVMQIGKGPDGETAVVIEGLARVRVLTPQPGQHPLHGRTGQGVVLGDHVVGRAVEDDRPRLDCRGPTPALPCRAEEHERCRSRIDVHRHGSATR